jgi:hypothetical protein
LHAAEHGRRGAEQAQQDQVVAGAGEVGGIGEMCRDVGGDAVAELVDDVETVAEEEEGDWEVDGRGVEWSVAGGQDWLRGRRTMVDLLGHCCDLVMSWCKLRVVIACKEDVEDMRW